MANINNEISITDYAKELEVSRQYIGKLITDGKLPKGIKQVKRIGKRTIILVRETNLRKRVA